MRSFDTTTIAELQARQGLVPRDFLWIVGRNRTTGALESAGFWNDYNTVTVSVVSGETGELVSREYVGSGSLVQTDPIPLVADLTVRTINVKLSQVNPEVAQAIRGYDARLAYVEVHRGLLSRDTRELIAPPQPHFVGWVNKAPIRTPPPGQEGDITLTVASASRALTRINPAKKSDETLKLRSSTDAFRQYAGTTGQWDIFWGEKKASASRDGASKARSVKALLT